MTRLAHPDWGTKVAISSHQSLGVLTYDLNSHHERQLSIDTFPSISLVLAHIHFLRLTFLSIHHSVALSQRSPSQIYLFSGGGERKKGFSLWLLCPVCCYLICCFTQVWIRVNLLCPSLLCYFFPFSLFPCPHSPADTPLALLEVCVSGHRIILLQ